ncbi:MAG: Hsp20/alpha crystallin family protein [Deltaproteobacteria bacterium]|nr:Hsp20/alpha crystallin family protein [Deltaproteobacteria bacterium]
MNLIKIRIADALDQIDQEFEKTVHEMFNLINPKFSLYQNAWRPQIDIYENTEIIFLLVDIAGVKNENLHIEINHKTVKIYGNRSEKPLGSEVRYRLAEIPSGYFERTVNLPASIDTNQIEAVYKDGLLQLTMAKLPLNRAYKVPVRNI